MKFVCSFFSCGVKKCWITVKQCPCFCLLQVRSEDHITTLFSFFLFLLGACIFFCCLSCLVSMCNKENVFVKIRLIRLINTTFVSILYSDSTLFLFVGASSLTVTGQKGGYITLPCNSSYRGDLSTVLTFGSTTAYGNRQDEHFRGRVHKSGNCNFVLQPLNTTDAGKYTLHVNANGLPKSYSHDVRVNVNLTARIGEEVKFDDLPRDAESVEHFTNTDLIDVWRKGQGFLTDRLTDKNGRLIIKNFTSSDAGAYRVLNKTGGILVTVTVTTESGTASKDIQDRTRDDKTKGTERAHACIGVVVLVALIVFAVFMKHRCLNRNKEQGVPMQETVQGPRSPNNSNGYLVVCFQCHQLCRGSCQHIISD
ncbi:uncharacterized protein [Sinocyclocheilus grahami]|uniref:uncharacterized protein isoform X1 n=1 Tax=Sinocyclocheilus grahami TaxID=75366 RepID=UPI0007AC9F00|nr:PREDICTED: uncharacterized protein LOC107562447 isoform X1 [Sinocyclocheilus grahami]